MLNYFIYYCWFLIALLLSLNFVLEIFNFFSNPKAYKQKVLVKFRKKNEQ